jgi:hypothetical protein
MNYSGLDVCFPSGKWVSPSPYNELYPFPKHTKQDYSPTDSATTKEYTVSSLTAQVCRLQTSLRKFKNVFKENNPIMLPSMEKLAHALLELVEHREAEELLKTVSSFERTLPRDPFTSINLGDDQTTYI